MSPRCRSSCPPSVNLPGGDGEKIATENAQLICEAALEAGTTVTIDMEDHTTTDSTLAIVRELRSDYPWLGTVLQAYLYRTEADCPELAYEGSRIRLCKGAYAEPATVAHTDPKEIDQAYVRCLKILMSGPGYPMVATHDPRLVEIALALAEREQRTKDSFELQMLYGSGRPSRRGWPDSGTRCGSTSRTAPTGTATWCAGWPRSPPTCGSSPTASCRGPDYGPPAIDVPRSRQAVRFRGEYAS